VKTAITSPWATANRFESQWLKMPRDASAGPVMSMIGVGIDSIYT